MLFSRLIFIGLICLLSTLSAAQEICDNRIDDDGDGLIDCLDPDCGGDNSCWNCVSEFYQIHSNSTIVALDPGTGSYYTIGTVTGASQINGAQFNHIDGHIYAPCVINGAHKLGRLDMDGSVHDTGLTLPGTGIFYAGGISMDGIMYISNGLGVHTIDLKQATLSVIATGAAHPGVADLALDNSNGLFYGIKSGGKLAVFNPNTYTTTEYNLAGSITNESGGFGAAWSCSDGSFFAYNNNSGKIYTVNPNNLTATLVLNGTGNLSINDGFNCILALPPLESNCSNGIDDDGDGLIDCADPDCYGSNSCIVEICDNGIDDDGDGWADCSDSECFALAICVEICDNGIDDNNNGLIDGDDPQCTTTSGVDGGLESNRRLSQKLANRNYQIKREFNEIYQTKKEGLIPFENNTKQSGSITSFIPSSHHGFYVSESTPIDLIDNTNAVEVAAADYYDENIRIASVLGIYSTDGVYEHSKYICDRLNGSRLLDMSFSYYNGGHFITYELLNQNQQREFAISFSAYLEDGKFHIENHWNLSNYTPNKEYYNFQIWSRSDYEILELLRKIVANLDDYAPVESYQYSALPSVFVSSAEYTNGKLRLQIKNKNKSTKMNVSASLRRSETDDLQDMQSELNLTGDNFQMVELELGYLYDAGISLNIEGQASDEIFIADGAWGIDTAREGNNIISHQVIEELREKQDDKMLIERDIMVDAEIDDYLNIYRSLDAKFNARDLSEFNNLSFTAAGAGQLQITFVKNSITEWEDQFRYTVELSSDEKQYNINLAHLESEQTEYNELDDVVMIVFSIINHSTTKLKANISIAEASLSNEVISSTATQEISNYSIESVPNPATTTTQIRFDSNTNESYSLKCFDALGRVIYTKQIVANSNYHSELIDISTWFNGQYFFTITDHNGDSKSGKIIKQ